MKVPNLSPTIGLKPREFVLLASYCGKENKKCSDKKPCRHCLEMCNVFDENGQYLRQLGDKP